MKIVYKLDKLGPWTLYAYAMPSSPVDMCNITEKTHVHSEYDTKYSEWLDSMHEMGIINSLRDETLKGHESVIVKFTIGGVWKNDEDVAVVINEFDKYMNDSEYISESKYVIAYKNINEFSF
jgi:GTP-dependent phosphoenolpyruvate carboxykinase